MQRIVGSRGCAKTTLAPPGRAPPGRSDCVRSRENCWCGYCSGALLAAWPSANGAAERWAEITAQRYSKQQRRELQCVMGVPQPELSLSVVSSSRDTSLSSSLPSHRQCCPTFDVCHSMFHSTARLGLHSWPAALRRHEIAADAVQSTQHDNWW